MSVFRSWDDELCLVDPIRCAALRNWISTRPIDQAKLKLAQLAVNQLFVCKLKTDKWLVCSHRVNMADWPYKHLNWANRFMGHSLRVALDWYIMLVLGIINAPKSGCKSQSKSKSKPSTATTFSILSFKHISLLQIMFMRPCLNWP